jgi:hypothetical protein
MGRKKLADPVLRFCISVRKSDVDKVRKIAKRDQTTISAIYQVLTEYFLSVDEGEK